MSALGQRRTQAEVKLVGDGSRLSRQYDPDFGEFARLRMDLNRAAMLLNDDVVADGQTETRAFPGRFGREEWIEHLFL